MSSLIWVFQNNWQR